MALNHNVEAFVHSSVGAGGSLATGLFTPPANSMLIARVSCVFNYLNGDPTALVSVTDSAGLTWFDAGSSHNSNSYALLIRTWYAFVGAIPVPMTVTINQLGSDGSESFNIDVLSYTGYDPVTPIRQFKAYTVNSGDAVIPPTILDMAPLVTSEVLSYIGADSDDAGAGLPGVGFSLILAVAAVGNPSIEGRVGSASTTVDWASVSDGNNPGYFYKYATLAVEVAASGAPPAIHKDCILPAFVPGV